MNPNRHLMTLDEFTFFQTKQFKNSTGELSTLLRDIGLACKLINKQVNKAGLTEILGAHGAVNGAVSKASRWRRYERICCRCCGRYECGGGCGRSSAAGIGLRWRSGIAHLRGRRGSQQLLQAAARSAQSDCLHEDARRGGSAPCRRRRCIATAADCSLQRLAKRARWRTGA